MNSKRNNRHRALAISVILAFIGVTCLLAASASADQKWGHLEVTIRYDGPPVKTRYFDTRNPDVKVADERIVVNPTNKGLQNVAVYLRNNSPVPIHQSYEKLKSKDVVVHLEDRRFSPHVFGLWTEQKLFFKNRDGHGYNPVVQTFRNPPVSFLIRPNKDYRHEYSAFERIPCPVICSVHPWMKAYAIIRDNPYIGISDEDGHVSLRHLPVGEHQIQFWHETAGYLSSVKINGVANEWTRGRLKVYIVPNKTIQLGVVEIPAVAFEKEKP